MEFKYILFSLLLFFSFSCKNTFVLSKVEYSNTKLDSHISQIDSNMSYIILPFSEKLDSKMNQIVGYAPKEFTKEKPESTLGNLLADATYSIAEKYSSKKPDLAIINYGGIRISNLAKGNITLGNVYELMPFDNYLVNIEIKGNVLQSAFDLMAINGVWPISGASYTIKNNKAIEVKIQEKPIQESETYTLAISDYLANGGDKMSMLKGLKSETTNILLREAFIEYFNSFYNNDNVMKSSIEKRVYIYE